MKRNNNLIRTSVQLPEPAIRELRRLAERRSLSVSQLIRAAIREFLIVETVDAGRSDDGK